MKENCNYNQAQYHVFFTFSLCPISKNLQKLITTPINSDNVQLSIEFGQFKSHDPRSKKYMNHRSHLLQGLSSEEKSAVSRKIQETNIL